MTEKECGGAKESCLALKEKRKVSLPPMWHVILLNDDYTTMDFVVMLLRSLFGKTEEEAERLMLEVHRNGRGAAGASPREIAESLAAQAMRLAKANGFPLRCIAEREAC